MPPLGCEQEQLGEDLVGQPPEIGTGGQRRLPSHVVRQRMTTAIPPVALGNALRTAVTVSAPSEADATTERTTHTTVPVRPESAEPEAPRSNAPNGQIEGYPCVYSLTDTARSEHKSRPWGPKTGRGRTEWGGGTLEGSRLL